MNKDTTFNYVLFGEDFTFGGITYTKTNLMRGFYISEGNKVFRKFKKTASVLALDVEE